MASAGSAAWKAVVPGRFSPPRATYSFIFRARFLLFVVVGCFMILLWRGLRGPSAGMHSWGPRKSPMEMTANEAASWSSRHATPVTFNHNPHAAVAVGSGTVAHVDLNGVRSSRNASAEGERVLLLTPLRDAAPHLARYFDLLDRLSYPHNLIDLAFLVSNSADDTMAVLAANLNRVQEARDGRVPFRSVLIVEKDFAVVGSQEVNDRHGWKMQGPRRRTMGRARNYLLATALKPDHSWVYWRDVDIVDSPPRILEDFMEHDKDVLVPNIWFHRYKKDDRGKMVDIEGRFDYNSWQETDKSRKVLAKLDKDFIIAEGYEKVLKTYRKHMARLGDRHLDKDEEMKLDGIGGVSILVKADVHRSGINFPCYPFENQAETEGFAKMARRAGYGVYGLPNYVVWHVDEDEKPGNM